MSINKLYIPFYRILLQNLFLRDLKFRNRFSSKPIITTSNKKKILTNSSDKEILSSVQKQREKYIQEIIKNFKELSDTKSTPNSSEDSYTISTSNKTFDKNMLNKGLRNAEFDTISYDDDLSVKNHDSKYQNTKRRKKSQPNGMKALEKKEESLLMTLSTEEEIIIDKMLKTNDLETFDFVIKCISEKRVPSFSILNKLTSWASQEGYPSKVKIFQTASETHYSKLYLGQCCFEHYLCEALFREGQHQKSLKFLSTLIEKYPGSKRVKGTAVYIMRLIPKISEENQKESLEIAKKFIDVRNEYKPAVAFWHTSIMSGLFYLQNLAQDLLTEYPDLLNNEDHRLFQMVDKAFEANDTNMLHFLIDIFLKLESREPLSRALSSLLSLYCMMENLSSANEILKFIQDEKLLLSPNVMRQFLNLLHKKQMPTSFSLLTFK